MFNLVKLLHIDMCVCKHSHTDSYSEVVPIDGPPSFRGQSVKYVYKLTIGCQRVNSPIKLLRVPFRVFVLQGEIKDLQLLQSFQPMSWFVLYVHAAAPV